MNQLINEKVSVITLFNHNNGLVIPKKMKWHGRNYLIIQLTYHHKLKEGKNIFHIFHVTDGNLDFRLRLNTDNLQWILEEVSDGNAN